MFLRDATSQQGSPRCSDKLAKHGAYLQSAVHYAATALVVHKVGAMRRGFSKWASYAYNTKLLHRRKITGDPAANLEEREQAYAEQRGEPGAGEQAAAMHAHLAIAWTYHEQSCAQVGRAEPMVKAWKQIHASAKVSTATHDG